MVAGNYTDSQKKAERLTQIKHVQKSRKPSPKGDPQPAGKTPAYTTTPMPKTPERFTRLNWTEALKRTIAQAFLAIKTEIRPRTIQAEILEKLEENGGIVSLEEIEPLFERTTHPKQQVFNTVAQLNKKLHPHGMRIRARTVYVLEPLDP